MTAGGTTMARVPKKPVAPVVLNKLPATQTQEFDPTEDRPMSNQNPRCDENAGYMVAGA